MPKERTIRGRANIPIVFKCPVTWYEDQIAYFVCLKQQLDLISDFSGCHLPRGQKQLTFEAKKIGMPIVVIQQSARMTITESEISFRGAETPLVIFGTLDDLSPDDEAFCVVTKNSNISAISKSLSVGSSEKIVRFGTLYQRVQLNTYWTELEIVSEPFVTNESWGYCPIVHVKTRVGDSKYLSVQPRSIRDLLEGFRSSDSGLVGMKIRIRKKTASQESGFEGFRIQEFSL